MGYFWNLYTKESTKNSWLENCIRPTLSPSWLLSYPSSDFTPCSFPAQQTDQGPNVHQLIRQHAFTWGQPVRLYLTVELNSPFKRMADIYVLWLFICSWAITLLISQHLSLPAASIITGNLSGSPSCSAAGVGTLFYCGCSSIKRWMWRFDSSLLVAVNGVWVCFCVYIAHTHAPMFKLPSILYPLRGCFPIQMQVLHATCSINPLCIHTMLAALYAWHIRSLGLPLNTLEHAPSWSLVSLANQFGWCSVAMADSATLRYAALGTNETKPHFLDRILGSHPIENVFIMLWVAWRGMER